MSTIVIPIPGSPDFPGWDYFVKGGLPGPNPRPPTATIPSPSDPTFPGWLAIEQGNYAPIAAPRGGLLPILAPLLEPPPPDPAAATAFQEFTAQELVEVDSAHAALDNFVSSTSPAVASGFDQLLNLGTDLAAGSLELESLATDHDFVDFTADLLTAVAAQQEAAAAALDAGTPF